MPQTFSPAQEESSAALLQNEIVNALTAETGLQGEYALAIAAAVAKGLRKQVGSQRIYIPAWPRNMERDAQIRREFNGRNTAEILTKHNISRSLLYQIVGKK